MKKYSVKSEQINLEITETAAAENLQIVSDNIHNLHQNGINLSLDDYGTGYSNINYIMDMPFEIVKIDKSVLWSSLTNEKAMIAMRSSISMIKEMGMKILVEGVETQEMIDLLTALHCDYLQGFFYSKPIPAEKFEQYMIEHNNI